jgi:succinate dehydrogenase flavin-adding protein (antitoxin of CptAB toxin-antitoxin module)
MPDAWRRRLLYRASGRSKLEAEELLGPFATQTLPEMDENDLATFERLLDLDDITLLEIFSGTKPAPEGLEEMFGKLRGFWKGSQHPHG